MKDILEITKRGQKLDDFNIIDSHCHIGHWHNFYIPENNAEGMLKSMGSLGIEIACITAHASIGPNYKYGNDIVMEAVKKYPERFIGYVTISPHYPEDMKNELKRGFSVPGMLAIKLHPSSHRCPIDYKNYKIAYETAEQKKCPILIHVFSIVDVGIVNKLADLYPGAQFIMGHAGGDVRSMEVAIEAVNRHSNIYVDLASSSAFEGNVEWLTKEMGSQKVLFGSDMPFYDPKPTFGRIAMADISNDDKANILGLNMKKLLKL